MTIRIVTFYGSFSDEELQKAHEEEPDNKIILEEMAMRNKPDGNGDLQWYLKENDKGKPVVDIDAVVNNLRHYFIFKTIYGKNGEEIRVFQDGIYQDCGKEIIKTKSEEILGAWAKTNTVNEIFEKTKRQTAVNRMVFDNLPLHLIPCNNGLFNITTKSLDKFDAQYPFTYKLPISYEATADCPNFKKFLEDVASPEDISVIQEWFGFCLYRIYFLKKGIIFVGVKDTGKSVLLLVLRSVLGQSNIASLDLQDITNGNTFDVATLYNKHANIFDDLSSKDLNNGGGFKMATGGGVIPGEFKFGDRFGFINFAKQTFACNNVPINKMSDDPAYYDRWMPIEFSNPIPIEDQDPFLINKLTTPLELSGIFNWSLMGLYRLLENKKFSYNKYMEEVKRIMERSGSPLAEFVQDVLVEQVGNNITKDDMFYYYSAWSKIAGRTRLSKEQLGRQLVKWCNYTSPGTGDQRHWKNIAINNKYVNKDTLDTFYKTIKGNYKEDISIVDMLFEKASIPSEKQTSLSKTDNIPDASIK